MSPKLNITAVELWEQNVEILKDNYDNVIHADFLQFESKNCYDAVIANPPFNMQHCEIDHTYKAFSMLNKGGRMAVIVGSGCLTNSRKKETAFQAWLEEHNAIIEQLPAGTFDDTEVTTSLILLER